MSLPPSVPNTQSRLAGRRRRLRWLRIAPLILVAAIAACAGSKPQYGRTTSDIRGSDHRDGPSQSVNLMGIKYAF